VQVLPVLVYSKVLRIKVPISKQLLVVNLKVLMQILKQQQVQEHYLELKV
jgi:hypothetical protein